MPVYRIGAGSLVVVSARSSIHDTRTTWDALSGTITADPADLGAAEVDVALDMTRYNAGDFLRNRKLRKDLDVHRHPVASFRLESLSQVAEKAPGRFTAEAKGAIEWRGRTVPVTASGEASVDAGSISGTVRFELDVRDFGVEPPRFLMFKVEEVVAVEVTLLARAA